MLLYAWQLLITVVIRGDVLVICRHTIRYSDSQETHKNLLIDLRKMIFVYTRHQTRYDIGCCPQVVWTFAPKKSY